MSWLGFQFPFWGFSTGFTPPLSIYVVISDCSHKALRYYAVALLLSSKENINKEIGRFKDTSDNFLLVTMEIN